MTALVGFPAFLDLAHKVQWKDLHIIEFGLKLVCKKMDAQIIYLVKRIPRSSAAGSFIPSAIKQ